MPSLDRWLLKIFDPGNVERTLNQLVAAQPDTDIDAIADDKILAEYDRKLARYGAPLEARPSIVIKWIHQVQAERAAAETRARLRSAPGQRMSREQIK